MSAATLYADLIDRGCRLRVDDDDRLIVSPGDLLSDADRTAIRLHKAELMAMASIDVAADPEPDEVTTAPRPIHPTPTRCLGPTACAILGVCGRESCLAAEEFGPYAAAMVAARRPANPHVVSDFYPAIERAA